MSYRDSRVTPLERPDYMRAVVCFVVRSGYRRHGLMQHLLAGAVQHAVSNDARVIEGYPVDAQGARVDVISGHVGAVALFDRAGFQRIKATTSRSAGLQRWVMRKMLP